MKQLIESRERLTRWRKHIRAIRHIIFSTSLTKSISNTRRKPVSVELPANLTNQSDPSSALEEDFQPEYECLKKYLATIPAAKRDFILDYYQENKKKKLANLKRLAESDGIEIATLHMRRFGFAQRSKNVF